MLIQDIKPYPSRLQAIVSRLHGQAVSMNGKAIKVRYIAPVKLRTATMFPDLATARKTVYEPTEDDYIQDRAQEVYEGAREYEQELLRGYDD